MDQEETKQAIRERFNNLQPEIQEAIMSSNYEKNLYEIGVKHKLTVEQMGKLEFNTTLVLLGQTHPDEYADDLMSDLGLPKETIDKIVNDVNEKIMKNILELIKQNFARDDEEEEAFKEVPLPPQEQTQNTGGKEKAPTPPYKKPTLADTPAPNILSNKEVKKPSSSDEIYKNIGIEIMNDDDKSQEDTQSEKTKNDSTIFKSGINMIKDKLDGMTISKSKTSDYSIPKMSTTPKDETKRQADPYHEPIE